MKKNSRLAPEGQHQKQMFHRDNREGRKEELKGLV